MTMTMILVLSSLIIVLAGFVKGDTLDCSQYQYTRQLDPLLTLDYVVNVASDGQGTFRGRLTLEGLNWIGFGHSEGGMVPGQSVVGSDAGVMKYYHTGKSPDAVNPTLSQTLTETRFIQNDTHSVLEFTKLLEEEGELPIKVGMNNFIFARGISNTLGFHRLGGYGNAPFEIYACGTSSQPEETAFEHPAFDGYSEHLYYPFYENLLGADYLSQCLKQKDPYKEGESCRYTPKTCLWGEQICPKNTPGGHIHPVTRCNCDEGRWTCFDFKCPTIQVPQVCPVFDPTNLDPPTICTSDMSCEFEDQVCCGQRLTKKRCTCQAGLPFSCLDVLCDEASCNEVVPGSVPTQSPLVTSATMTPTASTKKPARNPTTVPTSRLTRSPTKVPTRNPTKVPTGNSTKAPTRNPTKPPTRNPTKSPTRNPTNAPTGNSTKTPTRNPTKPPTGNSTKAPTRNPTRPPTRNPTKPPTGNSTRPPTRNPTRPPTRNPTRPPTRNPTRLPTNAPTGNSTKTPTRNPTKPPTRNPTKPPTRNPTKPPTRNPTRPPTRNPTKPPTGNSTKAPTKPPTRNPTNAITRNPTKPPTEISTKAPTRNPTTSPTFKPTRTTTKAPTPTNRPSKKSVDSPTGIPNPEPTKIPTTEPLVSSTKAPTIRPMTAPTTVPTRKPITNAQFRCPADETTLNFASVGSVELINSETNTLCTLVLLSSDSLSFKPIARSYNSFAWEPSAGEFSTLELSCTEASCVVNLPPLPNGTMYQLSTFFEMERSTDDIISRFLEQATFGPTRTDVAAFTGNSSDLAFASWIKIQQNVIAPTSHRRLFRDRLNGRFEVANTLGAVMHPCQKGSRYRRFAFSSKDDGKVVDITTVGTSRIVSVEGFVRTVIDGPIKFGDVERNEGSFRIEYSDPGMNQLGGRITMSNPNSIKPVDVTFNGVFGNPSVQFLSDLQANVLIAIRNQHATAIDTEFYGNPVQEIILNRDLPDDTCASLGEPGNPVSPVFAVYKGEYFMHDPRFEIIDNSLDSPALDGGGKNVRETANALKPENAAICSNAPRTFLNEDSCVLSFDPNACTSEMNIYSNLTLQVTSDMMRGVFTVTGNGVEGTRYVYAIDKLRIEDDPDVDAPCTQGTISRWMKVDCSGAALTTNNLVSELFGGLLSTSDDTNPLLRDIKNNDGECPMSEKDNVGFEVMDSEGVCWRNVHPDHLNVYDMTIWTTMEHLGNQVLFPRNPIKEFAVNYTRTTLNYPVSHDMGRWQSKKSKFGYLARLNDWMSFYDLPIGLRTVETSAFFGFTPGGLTFQDSSGVMVCGSPFETTNNPFLGGSQNRGAFDVYFDRDIQTTSSSDFGRQKRIVWTEASLSADDQLRQRVAWALAQILVISEDSVSNGNTATEVFLSYYDIFVRNAFGSYRNILKEVSYSAMMADMLSFYRSQSTAYVWRREARVQFADENYAREVMQLFSIGLNRLNLDGSVIIGKNGDPENTYTNDDIMEYARVWTGFTQQSTRGNIEDVNGRNRIDPMDINLSFRDPFPKMGMDQTYIGDGYPLCGDLPKKHFLSRGATYRLLGKSRMPESNQEGPTSWETSPTYRSLSVEPNGPNSLFTKLCGSLNPSACVFSSKVVLDTDLNCVGEECKIDTIRTVEVTNGIFYEYVRPPCVYKAFFNDATSVSRRRGGGDLMCADPRTESGTAACCGDSREWKDVFWGERTTLATTLERCDNDPSILCSRRIKPSCQGDYCVNNLHFWTGQPCVVQAKINENGMIGIVHVPSDARSFSIGNINPLVRNDTQTYFRVEWSKSVSIDTSNCEQLGKCETTTDGMCLCDVTVTEDPVFLGPEVPSVENVLGFLKIGAFDKAESPSGSMAGVTWYQAGNGTLFTADTVFEVVDLNGVRHYRKNMKSTIRLVGSDLTFRNPVHFVSLTEAERRDAHHETDAALDHYFYHPNHPPFLAIRFAQRFGISNPSSRYIKAIASAYRSGSYSYLDAGGSTISFGSGIYGDLAAMVACVLLDREARTPLLDADPTFGALKEPLIKIIGLMRSMEFQVSGDPLVDFVQNIDEKLGQMAHAIPDVFSFFLPEYSPPGPIAKASLVAPEGQALTSSRIIDSTNAILSLIKYGLSTCWGGLRDFKPWDRENCNAKRVGEYETGNGSGGNLSFLPASGSSANVIVDELATLLTSGRLPAPSRQLIIQAIKDEATEKMMTIKAQQLITLTPEFHATSISRTTGKARTLPESTPPSSKPYKAVVYVLLAGAMDSYNMLVPHTCSAQNSQNQTVLEQYNDIRGILALNDNERSRVIDVSGQPCSQYVVHPNLPIVEELYKAGDLSFFANTGTLNRPVNNKNYVRATKTRLFAHNTMQSENQKVDPYNNAPGSGALGRMCDILSQDGHIVQPMSIDVNSIAMNGVPGFSAGPDPMVVPSGRITKFATRPRVESFDIRPFVGKLNNETLLQSSVFGESWSVLFEKALLENEGLMTTLDGSGLKTPFPTSGFSKSFNAASSMIADRARRGKDRDVIFVSLGGWDHHSDMKTRLADLFTELNAALTAFKNEMVAQEVWDDVTLVLTSEFARTLTPNSGEGSDHAWGGNYFAMGGSIKGGQVHGDYPSDITDDSPLSVGRGRLIPTMSWESILQSVIEWMGLESNEDLDYCLPNRETVGTPILKRREVFKN